jgi:hypothetical protein
MNLFGVVPVNCIVYLSVLYVLLSDYLLCLIIVSLVNHSFSARHIGSNYNILAGKGGYCCDLRFGGIFIYLGP